MQDRGTRPQASTIVRVGPEGQAVVAGGGSPEAIYEAFRQQRSELSRQHDRLEEQRRSLSNDLQQQNLNSVDQKALEQRLTAVDQRIASTEAQLAEADKAVAQAAAIPGAVVEHPPPIPRGPPDEVYVLSGIFMFVVLLPLSIAYARRIWRRSATAITKLPQEIYDRFARLDQSVDAIAIEVERIGEGQRFLTRVLSDQQRALGAGAAERVEVPEREHEVQRRK